MEYWIIIISKIILSWPINLILNYRTQELSQEMGGDLHLIEVIIMLIVAKVQLLLKKDFPRQKMNRIQYIIPHWKNSKTLNLLIIIVNSRRIHLLLPKLWEDFNNY